MNNLIFFIFFVNIKIFFPIIFLFGQWIKPFDYKKGLEILCTDNNHFEVMRGQDSPLVIFSANYE